MKKLILSGLCLLLTGIFLYSSELTPIEKMIDDGRHREAVQILKGEIAKGNPELSVIWRMGWAYYEVVINSSKKSDKITEAERGMALLKPYLNITEGEKLDRAKILYWYAVLSSLKAEAKGIFESLGNLPAIFELCKRANTLAPTYPLAYHLMGMVGEAVPMGEYGDKFVMAENFSLALKYDRKNVTTMVDFARALAKRNWDVDKKASQRRKYKRSDGTPEELTDKQYAKNLLERAISIYDNGGKILELDTEKYNEGKKLLKKL